MYGKLFSSMYDGSLAMVGPWEALVTFQQMIILADREGFVDMTAEAISRRTIIPLEIIKKGIGILEQPDAQSRDPNNEGRRIERISDLRDWGWTILNYSKYRQIRTADERRAYQREYQAKRRAAIKTAPPKTATAPDLPAWIEPKQWQAWIALRKAPARSSASQAAAIAKLDKFRLAGHDPNAIIAESLANGWHGLFAPSTGRAHVSGTPAPAGTRCHYCERPAVRLTNEIPHCAAARHLDHAIRREH